MKKLSSLFILLFVTFTMYAQNNLIKDGKFEDTHFSVNDVYRTIADKGNWYPYLTGDRLAVLSVVDDDTKGKAVKFQSLSHVSYAYSYVGQRIQEEVKPGIYRVGVWAKSIVNDPLAVMNVYLRVNTPPQKFLFFKKAEHDPEKNPSRSGALYQIRITNEWKYYTFDFDLTETIDNAGNYNTVTANGKNITVERSGGNDLKDFFIAISSTTRNSQFLFTDVSLTALKVEDTEEEKSNVGKSEVKDNLIKDGKFEDTHFSVNDVYRTIADKGNWYPYLTGDRLAVLSVVDDDTKGKAVKFQSLSHVSYAYSYVGQRIQKEVKPGIYRVGVWAKSLIDDPLAVMNVYLRVNTPPQKFLFFKKAEHDPEKNPSRSGALYQIRITNEWKYYTFDFDLTETIDNAGNYNAVTAGGKSITVEKSNRNDLKDFFIAISSTTRNSQFLFTDVSFTALKIVDTQQEQLAEKKSKVEKTEVKGNLIKDGSFETTSFNVSDIYRTIGDKGKWYPYLTSDKIAELSIDTDDERGSVLKFKSLSNPSYAYGYVGQRIESQLEPAVYRVGFWAKSLLNDPRPVINVYLRVNTSPQRFLFFKLDNFKVAENPNRSGAIFQRFLTPKWEYYTIDFDLSKTIDSAAPYKLTVDKGTRVNIDNSTRGDRKDLYLTISSTSKYTQFFVTDVSLVKVE